MIDNTTILVVDDEPFNLEIIEDLLADSGYKLILVESGTEAWDILERNPDCCQVILLDRMLPDIDGLDLLRKIKNTAHLTNKPVIIQTARASSADRDDGIKSGAFAYLTKPFKKKELIDIVGSAALREGR